MEMIIAILLWLQVVGGPGQITQVEYDRMVIENQQAIHAVMSDPLKMTTVWTQTGIIAPTVIIGEGQ